jgi:hypothetical protein
VLGDGAPTLGFDDFAPISYKYTGTGAAIWQFRFAGNVTFKLLPATGVQADKAFLKAIFID